MPVRCVLSRHWPLRELLKFVNTPKIGRCIYDKNTHRVEMNNKTTSQITTTNSMEAWGKLDCEYIMISIKTEKEKYRLIWNENGNQPFLRRMVCCSVLLSLSFSLSLCLSSLSILVCLSVCGVHKHRERARVHTSSARLCMVNEEWMGEKIAALYTENR